MAAIKRFRNISTSLKVASCTLLSGTSLPATTMAAETDSEDTDNEWQFDAAYLHYSEKDRVTVDAPVFAWRKYTNFDEFVEHKLTLDTMSGASPNGATPSNTVQTFTGSSGASTYTTPANQTPMRDFSDTRVAWNYTREQPQDSEHRTTTGAAVSIEQDYASFGYNYSKSTDLDGKLSTITLGAGMSFDLVVPSGGAPDPLQNINTPTASGGGGNNDDDDEHEGGDGFDPEFKGLIDVLFGVTRIINRHTLMQWNYTHGFIRGYQTDPYKIVSVVDSTTGDPAITPGTSLGVYLNEKRPEERDTNAVFWKTVMDVNDDVLRFSYRYFWDDWGIRSHTLDVKYRLQFANGFYLQPHYRAYTQTAADFYRHSLRDNEALPEYLSADFRLAEFTGKTVGLKIGIDSVNGKTGKSSKFDIRVEKYTQTGDSHPDDAIGSQRNYDLYPTLESTIFQISYSTKF